MEYVNRYIIDFIGILNEMSPYLMLGFLFAGILKVAFPKQFIDRYLGQRNSRSVLNAALMGIPLPLCSCGVIPTGIAFYKNGATKGSSVSFLISTPQTGADSILVTYSLLGLPFALIRPVIALITGFAGGMMINLLDKKDNNKQAKPSVIEAGDTESSGKKDIIDSPNPKVVNSTTIPGKHSPFYTMLKYAYVDFLQDIAKWLIIGLLLAAFISALIPDNFFSEFIGNDLVGMFVILAASIPLYVCATATVPVAAILLMKGLSPGAALVLLMAGPATNVATITVLNKVLGRKAMWIYLLSIISGALIFGLLIDYFLPREWFVSGGLHDHMTGVHEGHFELPQWLKWGSSITLCLLILNGYWRKYRQRKTETDQKKTKNKNILQKKVIVNGMNCNHCKTSVEKEVGNLKDIYSAEVNLEQGILKVEGEKIDLNKIRYQIEALGFEFGGEVKT